MDGLVYTRRTQKDFGAKGASFGFQVSLHSRVLEVEMEHSEGPSTLRWANAAGGIRTLRVTPKLNLSWARLRVHRTLKA